MSDEDIRATDVETMGLEAVQAELRSTAPGAVRIQEHLERRQRLWRRLDALTKSPVASPPTPPVTLLSGTRGELTRHQAPTRAAALELARTMVDDAIAKERQSDWWPIETIAIKIEFDGG